MNCECCRGSRRPKNRPDLVMTSGSDPISGVHWNPVWSRIGPFIWEKSKMYTCSFFNSSTVNIQRVAPFIHSSMKTNICWEKNMIYLAC